VLHIRFNVQIDFEHPPERKLWQTKNAALGQSPRCDF